PLLGPGPDKAALEMMRARVGIAHALLVPRRGDLCKLGRPAAAQVACDRPRFRFGSAALCSSSMLSSPARMTARRMSERVASCQGVLRTPLRASTRVNVGLSSLTATWSFDDIVLNRSALAARTVEHLRCCPSLTWRGPSEVRLEVQGSLASPPRSPGLA